VTTCFFAALFFCGREHPAPASFCATSRFYRDRGGRHVFAYAWLQFAGAHIIPAVSSANLLMIGSTVTLGLYAAVIAVMATTSFLSDDEGKYALARRIAVGVAGGLALIVGRGH